MSERKPLNREAYSAGQIARRIGHLYDAYRPSDVFEPIRPDDRMLRLCVAFLPSLRLVSEEEKVKGPYRKVWTDWSYLKLGDYLIGPEGTFFVADIPDPKPMLVVETNTKVSLVEGEKILFSGYPACLMLDEVPASVLIKDKTMPLRFTLLIPNVDSIEPRLRDFIVTETNEEYIVDRAELTNSIWKLSLIFRR